jgi:hypothetical protein
MTTDEEKFFEEIYEEICMLRAALALLYVYHQDFMRGDIDQHTYHVRATEQYTKFKWLVPLALNALYRAAQSDEAVG